MKATTQNQKHIRVLYLDDEENNLKAFKASFRRDYDIYTAQTSEEAFEIVKKNKPHVIFSDQRMPVTSGVEFFNAIRQVFPEAVRILITGYTDVEDIIQAINKGHIYRYITKPWSEAEIRVAIENSYDLYITKQQLQEKMAALEKTNHELNRFIYSLSHDLRAPLATVLGLVRVSRLELKDEYTQGYFDKIESSVQKLDILLSNMIDYYRNNKAEDHLTEMNFHELLQDVLDGLRSVMGPQEPNLDVEIDQKHAFVQDEFRMRIIISHLISNAIKFKKPDQRAAKIHISFQNDANRAELRVKDEGIGILNKHIHKVFSMFFKTAENHDGAGLGLYIVKEALDKMEGSIDVRSREGQGTEFIIQLPNKI